MDLSDIIGAVALGVGAAVVAGVAALAVIFVVKITINAIKGYLNKAREIPGAKTAEIVKERLASGNYRVVANVFNSQHKELESQAWEGEKLDDGLMAEFGGKNKIIYDLTA